MKGMFLLALLVSALAAAGVIWYSLRRFKQRQLAEEARLASFIAASTGKAKFVETLLTEPAPAALPAAGDDLALQKLLFEAAHKAGEAAEPALAIQLYARLLSRYPASSFAVQARAAVEALKKKLGKA
jgi:hypothetical protein